ncbi:hypothetical protein R8Z50_19245 [Longispora sp. K20-0274]|uniref:hypothetical protein n=1 Tax=Longispora sp. K20-0274 TaxID=3088255 RepID=UPI0039996B41
MILSPYLTVPIKRLGLYDSDGIAVAPNYDGCLDGVSVTADQLPYSGQAAGAVRGGGTPPTVENSHS